MDLLERYGRWALIAGASEGTGRAYARQLARQGFALVLVARRTGPLDALATELRDAYGAEVVAASIDLAQPDAPARVASAAGGREVGLYISNAGADPNGARFLDRDAAVWRSLVTRNVLTTMLCAHHFAAPMRARGRGGLLLVNSFACYGGGTAQACYSGSKAFELTFAESLWSELRPHGVDVLSLTMGMTDTPAFAALLADKGLPRPDGVASAEDVAAFGLAHLRDGPVQNWGVPEAVPLGSGIGSAAERRKRVHMIDRISADVFGK